MSNETVARRYARAIFELGKEEAKLDTIVPEFSSFAQMLSENAELGTILGNPLVDEPSREGVLTELGQRLALCPTSMNALKLIARRRRLAIVPEIAHELAVLADLEKRLLRASVTSAGPLSQSYLDRLRDELERATGQKVLIDHQQDPTLIAGVVTRIGDRVIDGSLRARLASFRDSLTHA